MNNLSVIAGLDEVGRGAFAGPLVAGCVVLNPAVFAPIDVKINDSKKLSEKQRRAASNWIKQNALAWGLGSVTARYIDKHGLTKAAEAAFRKALKNARSRSKGRIERVIIDAFYVPFLHGVPKRMQFAIVGADGKSASVAAASIIAKVHRDEYMTELSTKEEFSPYKWNENKGYGTRNHQYAIQNYGTTKYHRQLFLRKLK